VTLEPKLILAKKLSDLLGNLEEATRLIKEALPTLAPLEVKVDTFPWTPYKTGKGEWILHDRVPEAKELLEALKANQGKLDLAGFHYHIQGERGQFIARYKCSGSCGR